MILKILIIFRIFSLLLEDHQLLFAFVFCASVAELVDAIDSKSIIPWDVSVQVGSEVP
jgi:hypothetical protein